MLLAYLALRGIQNDLALLDAERIDEHQAIAKQITNELDDHISAIEKALLDALPSSPDSQRKVVGRQAVEPQEIRQELVEEIFFIDNVGQLQFPFTKLLFLADGRKSSPFTRANSSVLSSGRSFEFQQQRYPEALASYQKAFVQNTSPQVKAETLNAIARVQMKANLLPAAIESYNTIAQDYSQIKLGNKMPLGLVAGLELGTVYVELDDSERAAKTFIRLYENLLHGVWDLEKTQFDFFALQTEEALKALFARAPQMQSYQNAFNMLSSEEKKQRANTERLLEFQENVAANLLTRASQNTDSTQKAGKRIALDLGERAYLVSLLGDRQGNGLRVEGSWGLLLNAEQLKTGVLLSAIQDRVPSSDLNWVVKGRDGGSILTSTNPVMGPRTVKVAFANNFPPWSLEFYQQKPRLWETLLASRRSIYLYMFILLAGILLFGLTLTIRIITQELELGRMKSDFVSTISHEFKSPLTAIRQLAEMLQSGRVPDEKRRRQYYDVLVEQSERLSLLVDNILDFAKMEEGKKELVFETVNPAALLEELVSTVQQQVRHQGLTIKATIDPALPSIRVDQVAMIQAITNLLDNAIKYSAGAKEVHIQAFSEQQELVIAVRDFGIGIKPEEIDKVFERFHRGGDELTRSVKGSGLGLTMVKKIVEAHHGTVHIKSEPGQGSTFSIKLPLSSTEE